MKYVLWGAGALVLLLAVGGWATKPKALSAPTERLEIDTGIDEYLAQKEQASALTHPLTPGAEKRVVWAGEPGEKTQRVVIYLHGFSATRQEIAPVPELVAKSLGANLFETRLASHGRLDNGPMDAPAEAWVEDGVEALAVGRALGDELILIGTSTGATIAAAVASHPDFESVTSLVFVSPNFGPARAGSSIAIGPYGPQIMRALAGEYLSWEAANEGQETFWTTRYRYSAVIEMMRLLELALRETPAIVVDQAMLVYSPKDDVVSVEKLLSNFELIKSAEKKILRVDEPASLSPHVLTGAILGPESVDETAQAIVDFLARKEPAERWARKG
ncbi:MAG: alpha/beta fold hydrolase [Pseudomonadota bacterium]